MGDETLKQGTEKCDEILLALARGADASVRRGNIFKACAFIGGTMFFTWLRGEMQRAAEAPE